MCCSTEGAGPRQGQRKAADDICTVEETPQDKGRDQKNHGDWHGGDDADHVGSDEDRGINQRDARAPLDDGPTPRPMTCGGNWPPLVPVSSMMNQHWQRQRPAPPPQSRLADNGPLALSSNGAPRAKDIVVMSAGGGGAGPPDAMSMTLSRL